LLLLPPVLLLLLLLRSSWSLAAAVGMHINVMHAFAAANSAPAAAVCTSCLAAAEHLVSLHAQQAFVDFAVS
jgi:hypothetical protein